MTLGSVLLILAPLIAALCAMLPAAVRQKQARDRRRALEQARSAQPQPLRPGQLGAHTHGRRQETLPQEWIANLIFCGVGTYAWKQIARDLILLERNGMQRLVAWILIVEHDGSKRDACLAMIPSIYRDRLSFGYSEAFGGGFRNNARWAVKNYKRWARDIRSATHRAIDGHFARNHRTPTDVVFYVSEGGTMPCGIPVLQVLSERLGRVMVTAWTALPLWRRLRRNLRWLKRLYDRLGVAGWVVQDNLTARPHLLDTNGARLIVALYQAALSADGSPAFNNMMSLLLPEDGGGIIIYEAITASVAAHPIQPRPAEPPYSYVYQQQVEDVLHTALDTLNAGRGQRSVDIPTDAEGGVVDVIVLPLLPTDVLTIADAITQAREDDRLFNPKRADTLFGRHDYETIWASLAEPLDAANPQAPITVIRLMAPAARADLLEEIVLPPQLRTRRATTESELDAVLEALFADAEQSVAD